MVVFVLQYNELIAATDKILPQPGLYQPAKYH